MGVVVQFDYAQWLQTYPEFTNLITQPLATTYFGVAVMIQRNDGGGPINDPVQQLTLLNMLVAHIAAIFGSPAAGQAATPSGIVGRISGATQGSVNVQAAAYSSNVSPQMAWFIQTKYGAMWWTATAPFRTMRYLPNINRGVVGPRGFGV